MDEIGFALAKNLVYIKKQEGKWVSKANGSNAYRSLHIVVDGKLYVMGGVVGNTGSTLNYDTSNRAYDQVTNTWSIKASCPVPNTEVLDSSVNKLTSKNGEIYFKTLENKMLYIYNTATNTWKTKTLTSFAVMAEGLKSINWLCIVNDDLYIQGINTVPRKYNLITDTTTTLGVSVSGGRENYPDILFSNKIYNASYVYDIEKNIILSIGKDTEVIASGLSNDKKFILFVGRTSLTRYEIESKKSIVVTLASFSMSASGGFYGGIINDKIYFGGGAYYASSPFTLLFNTQIFECEYKKYIEDVRLSATGDIKGYDALLAWLAIK